jgi:hypothetical protein
MVKTREILKDIRGDGVPDITTVDGDIATSDDDPNLVLLSGVLPRGLPTMYEIPSNKVSAETFSEPEPEAMPLEIGEQAVKTVELYDPETDDIIEAKVFPSEHDRLRFAEMTPELFDSMTIPDKQFVALSIYAANHDGSIGLLPEGMVRYVTRWLMSNMKPRPYLVEKTFEVKYKEITQKHQDDGDCIRPWVKTAQVKSTGKTKASVVWTDDYASITNAEPPTVPSRFEGGLWLWD